MPTPPKKTPQRVARMMAMHGAGASAREIGDELEVSQTTAAIWLREAGLTPNGGSGSRKDRRRSPPGAADSALAGAQKDLAELAASPVPTDLAGVLARLRENYALVSALVEFHVDGARKGTSSMAELDKAISIQERFAVKIQELTPAALPDPESDPTNVHAAASVQQKLATLVDVAEREVRCIHCGKPPFAPKGA